MNRHHWAIILGALLLAAAVGAVAYNIGLSQSGTAAADWDHHHHWHGPWFLFPLFFLFFWVFAWRGARRGCGYSLDEWHRRAHERMWNGEQQDHPDRR